MPRLGEPRHCTPAAAALAASGLSIPPQQPIPDLSEPQDPFTGEPSDEVLATPTHDRLTMVAHYAAAGWANAIPDCWLRVGVIDRLQCVCDTLPDGFGLAIFDGWRPRNLQAELFRAAAAEGLPHGLIAEPSRDLLHPAPHETGGAVDVTLTAGGVPIAPGTDFDEMTPASAATALEDTPGVDRDARRLLYWAMRTAGFVVYEEEWWHFEYGTRRWAAITGETARYAASAPPPDGQHGDE